MDYKEVIESRYNRQNWQLLLHDIFGNKIKFWNTPSTIPTSSQFAKQALWLGTITLTDNQTISIYEVELSDSVDIERNRRGIRDMLLTDWRNNGNAGAFMFCYRKNESVLRFSYVSEAWTFADDGSYQKESTDAKRFTYLLGEGHRSRTAIQQFEKLRDSSLTLKDLTKAFSVDAVSDMFFDGYKKQYEDIIQYITGKRMVKVANKWEEQIKNDPCEEIMQEFAHFSNPEKAVRDYVKKLMGRLVFLQFLQKKGWLGVPAGAEWGTGDAEFIQNLFAQTADKDHFIDNVLESLFNDLNSENEKKLPQYRTPYLNGGLFERDATDETEFPLPAKYMQSLLDFFASYNFTIDENDPDDAEVGVDPEMLGRIFENLLEDNKDKGAFYTPKEIVSYMCRESLIAYLQTGIEDEATKEAIRQFVTTHDVAILGTNDKFCQQVDEALKNVKICDPAIGSGAFPMGLLKELFQCRTALEGISQHQAAEIKKHIIQQNIYGVDIERGAVDIARLRFWLSLIVDEETPQALPNLDFKIMQGNSLLEQYKDVDLSTVTDAKWNENESLSFFDDMLDVLRRDLRIMLAQYYDCSNHEQKVALKASIMSNVEQQLAEQHIPKDLGGNPLDGNNLFFLWHTWFFDVFAKGGFDIVIANPPYIKERDNKKVFDPIVTTKWGKKYHAGKMDYWYYFLHRALEITHDKSYICYITSRYWINSSGSKKLIRHINETSSFVSILDIGSLKLFDNVVGHHMVTLYNKGKRIKECLYSRIKDSTENITAQKFDIQKYIPNDSIISDKWEVVLEDRKELECTSTLKDYCKISQGVVEASDKISSRMYKNQPDESYHVGQGIFVLTKSELDLLNLSSQEMTSVREYLGDGAITRYNIDYNQSKYLIYADEHYRYLIKTDPNYSNIKAHLDHMSKYITSCWKPYGIHRARKREYFENNKIIAPSMFAHPLFAIDMDNLFVGMSYNVIIPYDLGNIYWLTGLLNSKFADNWFYKNAKHRGVGVDVGVDKLRDFPIPPKENFIFHEMTELVKSIMHSKDCGNDTSALESEIDHLVYQLYGLTDEEIKIIEGS